MYTAFARDVSRRVAGVDSQALQFRHHPTCFYFKVADRDGHLAPRSTRDNSILRSRHGHELNPDMTESFRIFQSRILAQYEKVVDEFQLITVDATKESKPAERDAPAVGEALKDYKQDGAPWSTHSILATV